MKIIIDFEDDIQYMSFYIKGLQDLFGKDNISYSFHAFDDIPIEERHTRSMRFIIKKGINERRYVIDTNDSYRVNEILYNWSDVYGSVNANFAKTPANLQKKLISLCPSFAIRFTNVFSAVRLSTKGMVATRRNKRKYVGCWKRTLQRPRMEEYTPYNETKDKYIFHLSTLWRSDEWNKNDQGVNLRRAEFIRACKSLEPQVTFKGGLVTSRTDESIKPFSDCLAPRYTSVQCLLQTKLSSLVFNTPAYWDCHGWKLGEYMALGKAILTTPLSNDLPSPLVHGEHIHQVNNCEQETLQEAILLLTNDSAYRKKLENNIRQYWSCYGTPESSLRLIGIAK